MQKRSVYFMIGVLFICITLTGCSVKGPDSTMLKSDLTNKLQSYYPFLNLASYSVEQSLTEDSYYTATVSVVANNEYAEYDLCADISYTKYDQGWRCNYCDWTTMNCTVTNWPTETQMEDFLYERAMKMEDSLQFPTYSTLSNDGQFTLMYAGSINAEYKSFAEINGNIVSYWNYSPEDGTFLFDRDDGEISLSLTKNIEGTWEDERDIGFLGTRYPIIITDQDKDRFTIEYGYLKDTVCLIPQSLSEFEESQSLIFF